MSTGDQERVLRTEKADLGMFGGKGWLTLTNRRLLFGKNEDFRLDIKWSVPLDEVESARAKKAFRKGVEVLEVFYRAAGGKREQKSFERMSWAQWATDVGRAEQNSLAAFEQAILAARDALQGVSPSSETTANPVDVASQFERLAELHRSGILTDDEFASAKARILG